MRAINDWPKCTLAVPQRLKFKHCHGIGGISRYNPRSTAAVALATGTPTMDREAARRVVEAGGPTDFAQPRRWTLPAWLAEIPPRR